MKIGILAQIFANDLHVVECNRDYCLVRTNDVVPFIGDFVVVELTPADWEDGSVQDLSGAANDDMFASAIHALEDSALSDEVLRKAARHITKIITGYALDILNTQAKELGQPEVQQMYQTK